MAVFVTNRYRHIFVLLSQLVLTVPNSANFRKGGDHLRIKDNTQTRTDNHTQKIRKEGFKRMNVKKKARRVMSGLLTAVTVLSTVLSPAVAYASDDAGSVKKIPYYEEIKDQLDEDEVVTAKDYEIKVGDNFDVKSDYTGLTIQDDSKVKVTFQEAKDTDGNDFSTDYANSYKAVYYVEPQTTNHPTYQINRKIVVKEADQQKDSQSESSSDQDAGSSDETETEDSEADSSTEEIGAAETESKTELTEKEFDAEIEATEDQETVDPETGITLSEVMQEAVDQEVALADLEAGESITFDMPMMLASGETGTKSVTVTAGSWYYYADYGLGSYLTCPYDTVKQQHIYQQMQTLNGKRIYEWKYQNKIYFLKYYPEKEIAETFETSYKTNLLVWDFTQNCSEVLKKQIFYTLSRIIANTSMSKAYRNVRLKSLKLLYDSCVQLNITDIGLLEMEQVETILKNFPETSQRSILGECRRDAFMQQEQIQWEANVWYLERLHLGKHRIDESKSLISISFMEVKEIQNREILQAYMKYELGITGQAVSTIVRRFVCIRNFIELLEQEKILAIHATVAEVKKYADGLRERGIQAKGFNERIFGIGHFYKFMEVKQYITRMPFRIEYFQQKEVIVHHDRSVEETVYMEILKKLYLFPERLRCMFLHLWCLGLRASEVCTLKGNAYYQQGEDYWIQVYQVKMKNYKRIPIPQALYQIMKVYLKKHEIQPEEFIFKNSRGGACLYGTFRTQMIEACRENKIANGEYLFQSHDYRHTVATMFYDSHVSLQSIRDYLGHTYEEMTRQYIDYMPQRIAKANDEFFEMQGSSLASWLKKEEKDGK